MTRHRQEPDYDRCGYGCEWGCGEFIGLGEDAALVMNAAEPVDGMDNGHRLAHVSCLPAEAVPLRQRRKTIDLTERGRRGILRAV